MQINFNAQIVNKAPVKKASYQHTQSDSSLRGMLDRANAALVEYRGRVSAMQKRIAELEKSAGSAPVQHRDSRLDEMESRIEELEEARAEAEAALDVERARGLATHNELKKAQSVYDALKEERDNLKAENEDLKAGLEKAKAKLKKRGKRDDQDEAVQTQEAEPAPVAEQA